MGGEEARVFVVVVVWNDGLEGNALEAVGTVRASGASSAKGETWAE